MNKQKNLALATYSDEKVDHEEDVECQIYLLRGVLSPGHAGLNSVTKGENNIHYLFLFLKQKLTSDYLFSTPD